MEAIAEKIVSANREYLRLLRIFNEDIQNKIEPAVNNEKSSLGVADFSSSDRSSKFKFLGNDFDLRFDFRSSFDGDEIFARVEVFLILGNEEVSLVSPLYYDTNKFIVEPTGDSQRKSPAMTGRLVLEFFTKSLDSFIQYKQVKIGE